MDTSTKAISVKELLSEKDIKFQIPIYQRPYEWEIYHVRQLIEDICAAAKRDRNKNYYIGTIVCYKRHEATDIIDGQQRFITLHLINRALNTLPEVKTCNLSFDDFRKSDNDFLQKIYNDVKPDNNLDALSSMSRNYKEIENILTHESLKLYSQEKKLWEDYFLNQVKIIITYLPDGTDLNRYFEIMNLRGQQLEQHEILKAQMLDALHDSLKKLFSDNNNNPCDIKGELSNFAKKWDKCAEMDYTENGKDTDAEITIQTLTDIINLESEKIKSKGDKDGRNKKFRKRIIDFSNFLMIALRIFVQKNDEIYHFFDDNRFIDEIPLDDKKLLPIFRSFIINNPTIQNEHHKRIQLINDFCNTLEYLYDNFSECIIHRNEDQWAIGDNHSDAINLADDIIIAIQTLFHSVYTSGQYKYWLYHALKFNSKSLHNPEFWKDMARHYFINFYCVDKSSQSDVSKNYEDILNTPTTDITVDENKLTYLSPVSVKFALKLYDFIIWEKKRISTKIDQLCFSSDQDTIEHFYPQNAVEHSASIRLDGDIIHKFGNLCLISASLNSRLTNSSVQEKKNKLSHEDYDSLKLADMVDQSEWYNGLESIKNVIIKNTDKQINKLELFIQQAHDMGIY